MLLGYPEGAACELPLEWRLRVLEARVDEATRGAATIEVRSADELPPERAGWLMSEVYSRGEEFPVVLVDGRIACIGSIEPGAVVRALLDA